MSMTGTQYLSLAGFQGLNSEIYLVVNDRNYSPAQMVSRVHRFVTRVLKLVRKGQTDGVGYHLSMALSWSFALANRFHIDLEKETWERFPGVCPYCGYAPCCCKERAQARKEVVADPAKRPATFREFQTMFREIYPANTLQESAMHLAEEAGELDEALEYFMGTHDDRLFAEVVVELVDAITNMCAVASCLNLDLAVEMEKHFSKGCSKCNEVPCGCRFVMEKTLG